VSSSGAPRKIEGMKSRKVCVIDIATIKTTKAINGMPVNEESDARRIAATRFM